jgi:hypothetical protein
MRAEASSLLRYNVRPIKLEFFVCLPQFPRPCVMS